MKTDDTGHSLITAAECNTMNKALGGTIKFSDLIKTMGPACCKGGVYNTMCTDNSDPVCPNGWADKAFQYGCNRPHSGSPEACTQLQGTSKGELNGGGKTCAMLDVSKDAAIAIAQCEAFGGTLKPQMCKDIDPYYTMKTDDTGHSPITAAECNTMNKALGGTIKFSDLIKFMGPACCKGGVYNTMCT